MTATLARLARQSGMALLLVSTSALTAAALPVRPTPRGPTRRDVSDQDIAASNAKVKAAYDALVTMWSGNFKEIGERFHAPQIIRYRGTIRTSCGIMPADNAQYCADRNAIFYDEVFLARQARIAADALGTDGDMAAVGIIAHEMGHAVTAQVDEESHIPYDNEAAADCLAGAFTQQTKQDGTLEKGDLEEAFFGLASAGDPPVRFTGNPRVDARLEQRAQMMGHGTREQRLSNFKAGFEHGPSACLIAFR